MFAAAAADDKYADFVQIMSWLFGVSHRPESRLAQYPDGGHAAIIFKTHPELADTIAQWFAAVLPGTPGAVPDDQWCAASASHPRASCTISIEPAAQQRQSRDVPRRPEIRRRFTVARVPVNQLGYEHMLMKDYPAAIDLMKLNAAHVPGLAQYAGQPGRRLPCRG